MAGEGSATRYWTPSLDSQGYFQLESQLDPIVAQDMTSNTLKPTGKYCSGLAHGTTLPIPEFLDILLALAISMIALAVLFVLTEKTRWRVSFFSNSSPKP
jgi:hypothetical protein